MPSSASRVECGEVNAALGSFRNSGADVLSLDKQMPQCCAAPGSFSRGFTYNFYTEGSILPLVMPYVSLGLEQFK